MVGPEARKLLLSQVCLVCFLVFDSTSHRFVTLSAITTSQQEIIPASKCQGVLRVEVHKVRFKEVYGYGSVKFFTYILHLPSMLYSTSFHVAGAHSHVSGMSEF